MNLSPTTGSCRYRDWSTSSFLMNCVQSSSSTEEGSKKFERLFFVFFIFCRLNIHHRFLIGLMHYWWDLRTSSCKKNNNKKNWSDSIKLVFCMLTKSTYWFHRCNTIYYYWLKFEKMPDLFSFFFPQVLCAADHRRRPSLSPRKQSFPWLCFG